MQDIVFALRQILRQPGLSAAAVLTLGLGLGASLAVFTLVNAVLLRPLPYPEPDRLMMVSRLSELDFDNLSHRDVRFLRTHVHACGPIGAFDDGTGLNASVGGRVAHVRNRLVSVGYFEALGITPQWGRAFTVDEDVEPPPPVAILVESFVRSRGLEPSALVGQDMLLGGTTHTIVGIIGRQHTLSSDPDVYLPLGNNVRGAGQNLGAVCRLAAGTTAVTLNTELDGLIEEARRANLAGEQNPRVYVARERHEAQLGFARGPLLTLMVAVGLVLLVAAANTAGLLLVRAANRRREIAVRVAIGARPARVARALITEGLVLAALAGAIGLAAAPLLIRGLLLVAPAGYVQLATYTIDRVVIAAALGLCALVGLSVSLPPLMEVLRVNVRDALQEEGRSGSAGRATVWLRQLLIGAETAICAVLLVGALLLLRTFVNLVNVPTGFDAENVVTARMAVQGPQYDDAAHLVRFFENGIARLERTPGIERAGVAASLPAERALNLPARLPDSATPRNVTVINWRYVTPDFFELLRIPHVAGRILDETDRPGAPSVAVVNETFARQFFGGTEQALRKRIAIVAISKDVLEPVREIVGVVADTAGWTLGDPPRPLMFVPLAQVDGGLLRRAHSFFAPRWVVRGSTNTAVPLRQLETVVRELDPAQPFVDIRTVESLMLSSIEMQRFYLAVLMTFAVFAVVLAAVGLYAAYSYAIASRTTEIGIRLALGASPRTILFGVVGRALLLGGLATAVGLLVAVASARILRTVLYGVGEADPLTYGIVAAVLLMTVLVATGIPAMKAARIDPLSAIRR